MITTYKYIHLYISNFNILANSIVFSHISNDEMSAEITNLHGNHIQVLYCFFHGTEQEVDDVLHVWDFKESALKMETYICKQFIGTTANV